MNANMLERAVSLTPISTGDPSKYLVLVFVFLAIAFTFGLLMVLVTRKTNQISERPPVFGADSEIEEVTESNVDMNVPGAEDLILVSGEIPVQPVPQLGHPDDEGVPVPKYDEETKALVVDTDVSPVDVNADVPAAPLPAVNDELDGALKHDADTIASSDSNDTSDTASASIPDNSESGDTSRHDTVEVDTKKNTTDTKKVTANSNNNASDTKTGRSESNQNATSQSVSVDTLKEKIEEFKGKASGFFEAESTDAPTERIKRVAADAKDKAEEKAVELKDKAYEIATSEKAQEIRNSLEEKAGEAKKKAKKLWKKTKESAKDESSFLGKAKRTALGARDKAKDYVNKKNPPKKSDEQ